MGRTPVDGRATTGPHVLREVKLGGRPIDPFSLTREALTREALTREALTREALTRET